MAVGVLCRVGRLLVGTAGARAAVDAQARRIGGPRVQAWLSRVPATSGKSRAAGRDDVTKKMTGGSPIWSHPSVTRAVTPLVLY